jgi:hypothetical protein
MGNGVCCQLHAAAESHKVSSFEAAVCTSVLLAPCFTLISCLAYCSTQNMEATCSSETSVGFRRTARRYFPEERTLQPASFLTVCIPV